MQKKKKRRWSALISLLVLMAVTITQIVTPLKADEIGDQSGQVLDAESKGEQEIEAENVQTVMMAEQAGSGEEESEIPETEAWQIEVPEIEESETETLETEETKMTESAESYEETDQPTEMNTSKEKSGARDASDLPEFEITITTPEDAYIMKGVAFNMMNGVSASDGEGNIYPVVIKSVESTEGYTWDGSAVLVSDTLGETFTITYIVENSDDTEEPYATKVVKIQVQPKENGIGDVLDGDYAYMEASMYKDTTTESGYAIRTGSAPFDADEKAGDPGVDQTGLDNIVRSFDVVTYTVEVKNKIYSDSPKDAYKEGTIHYEFAIEEDSSRAVFDEGSMGWLLAKKDGNYTSSTEMIDGKEYQIIRGSFTWEPSKENPSAIGASSMTLNIGVRVLAMTQGEKLQPQFTFWMDYNHVPETGLVTGTTAECPVHKRIEPVTVEIPEVEVTSYPAAYNVRINAVSASHSQYKGTFDFRTGNALAQNKDKGQVTGRLMCYGITLQMVGKSAQHGLRGMELPAGDITFDLDVSANFKGEDSNTNVDLTDDYTPLLWSYEPNAREAAQKDGRAIPAGLLGSALGAPLNSGHVDLSNGYHRCYQGGNWSAKQTGATISVTVSDYQIDLSKLPYGMDGSGPDVKVFYDPDQISGYWDIQKACFSAGEFWLVQPFNKLDGTDSKYVVTERGESGTFETVFSDRNLQTTTVIGREYPKAADNSNQGITTDDRVPITIYLTRPGNFAQQILYKKYKDDRQMSMYSSLIFDCYATGKDWSVLGGEFSIHGVGYWVANDVENRQVAGDYLIKFDDEMIDLEGTSLKYGGTYSESVHSVKVLYAAKKDNPKAGWSDDQEMKNAVEEDLIFFSSLEELEGNGYICVAALAESRGLGKTTATLMSGALINAKVKNDPSLIGNVYMISQSTHLWTINDLESDVAAFTQKEANELTDSDYNNYVKNTFPSRLDSSPVYPAATVDHTAANTGGIKNYEKARYDENGYSGGHTGGEHFGDSLYIAGYTTKITKHLEQKSSGVEKLAYDMDTNQRIADFVLYPSTHLTEKLDESEGKGYITTVYVEDTLPKGLTYVPGSANIGGTYIQNGMGVQGTIENGTLMEPSFTINSKGQTVLTWTFTDHMVGTEMPAIHFAVEIGTPANEETDVINNESLLNTVKIWGTNDVRDFTIENGNKGEKGLVVSKNNAISISKYATQMFVEADDPIEYILNVGNNADNPMTDVVALESLPYDGDIGNSRISGEIVIESYTLDAARMNISGIRVFYTESEGERGKISSDYTANQIRNDSTGTWKEAVVNADGTIPELNNKRDVVAVAMVGTIPGQKTLKATVVLRDENGKPEDYLVNHLTRADFEAWGRSYIIQRRIEGVTWNDANQDGERQSNEKMLPNVKVVLYKDGVKYADTTSDSNGYYSFEGLPAGDYKVEFISSDDVDFSTYKPSPDNADGVSDTKDSDGVSEYDENGKLNKTVITGISLPKKEDMKTYLYESKYNDSGFYKLTSCELTGTKALTGRTLAADEFEFEVRDAGNNLMTTGKNNAAGKIIFKDPLIFDTAGTYVFTVTEKESSLPAIGYDKSSIKVTVTVTFNETKQEPEVTNITYKKITADGEESATGIVFNNTYTPTPTSYEPSITKTVTGTNPEEETFTFVLTGVSTGGDTTKLPAMPADSKNGQKEIQLTGAGTRSFGKITYDKAGTYVYEVSETAGTSIHYDYDGTKYVLTVTVTDDPATGKLSIDTTRTTVDNDPDKKLEFTNTYDQKSIFHPLTGTKTLTGRDLMTNEFEFEVREKGKDEVVTTGKNGSDGSITFENSLKFTKAGTYTYLVSEKEGDLAAVGYDRNVFEVTITVDQDIDKKELSVGSVTYKVLHADETVDEADGITFNNTYVPDQAAYEPEVTKIVTGENPKEETFMFMIKGISDNAVDHEKEVSLTGPGKVSLGAITYTEKGVYIYEISEKAGSSIHYDYDRTKHILTVTVADDPATGKLSISTEETSVDGESGKAIEFTNPYDQKKVFFIPEGTKTLTGRTLKADEFEFEIKDSTGNVVTTGTNDSTGKLTFKDNLLFNEAGSYTYTVSEKKGTLANITYDTKVFEVTIEVVYNETEKALEIKSAEYKQILADGKESSADKIVFENVYTSGSIQILKVDAFDENEYLEGAEFVLYKETDGTISYYSQDNAGNVTWQENQENAAVFITNANGIIEIIDLEWGTYYIKEIAAPEGYLLDETPQEAVITEENAASIQTLTFLNAKDPNGGHLYEELKENIKITKATNKGSVSPNEKITYTIVVKNHSEEKILTDITVKDYVPDNTKFVSAKGDHEYGTEDGKEYVSWFIDSLLPGESMTFEFTVKVDDCIGGTVIKNTAFATRDSTGKLYSNEVTNSVEEESEETTVKKTTASNSTISRIQTTGAAKTGDSSVPLYVYAILLILALGTIIFVRKREA